MASRPETAALLPRIAAGDAAAFGAFYDAWFDGAFALAKTISRRDESFCLDVVQDVMLKVSRGIPALRDESAVAAWMSRTVWTHVLDRLRSERRRQRREREVAGSRAEAWDRDPWQLAVAGERAAWLQAQLLALPADERRLLQERFGGEATLAAVGARLGLSEDAAHGRIRRILIRLRHAADEWWHDGRK